MNIEVKNLAWSDDKKSMIDCEILHPIHGWIPFTANPDDIEPHGREIFAMASAGDFGPIGEYEARPTYPLSSKPEQ